MDYDISLTLSPVGDQAFTAYLEEVKENSPGNIPPELLNQFWHFYTHPDLELTEGGVRARYWQRKPWATTNIARRMIEGVLGGGVKAADYHLLAISADMECILQAGLLHLLDSRAVMQIWQATATA